MNSKWRTTVILGLAVAAVAYVFFTNVTVPKVGSDVGDAAPDFQASSYQGEKLSLSSFEEDVVILNMWASWCEPCTEEIPALIDIHENYQSEGLTLVTLNMNSYERTREDGENFVKELDMTRTPALIDEDGSIAEVYNIQALPTTYIIDRNGIIVEKISGEVSFAQLDQIIQEYM
ncbi:TlpA family protein disulfide reductase [Alteribacillus sp. HJP-4]|uniref:TlpA family protein disulfide reductase n=1 Tax=Alteribacillus sp. HJP-4 TaxID=2775394 RepID=UPI0035CD1D9A